MIFSIRSSFVDEEPVKFPDEVVFQTFLIDKVRPPSIKVDVHHPYSLIEIMQMFDNPSRACHNWLENLHILIPIQCSQFCLILKIPHYRFESFIFLKIKPIEPLEFMDISEALTDLFQDVVHQLKKNFGAFLSIIFKNNFHVVIIQMLISKFAESLQGISKFFNNQSPFIDVAFFDCSTNLDWGLGTTFILLCFVKECINWIMLRSIAGTFLLAAGINGLYLDAYWDLLFENLLRLSKDLGVLVRLELFPTEL